MITTTNRQMVRAFERLDAAAKASVAARYAEEEAADASAGGDDQRRLRAASRVLRDLSGHRISEAGRLATGGRR